MRPSTLRSSYQALKPFFISRSWDLTSQSIDAALRHLEAPRSTVSIEQNRTDVFKSRRWVDCDKPAVLVELRVGPLAEGRDADRATRQADRQLVAHQVI